MAREHQRAKAAFERAVTRLRTLPELQHSWPQPPTDAQREELSELAQAAVVEALVWARAFDHAARGVDGLTALAGYPSMAPEEMQAAVYVANKGIHLLIEFTDVAHAPSIGGYAQTPWAGSLQVPVLRWVTPGRLPLDRVNKQGRVHPGDVATRTSFVNRWAGQPVPHALSEVETWLNPW